MKDILYSQDGKLSQTKTYISLFVLTLIASIICGLCGVVDVVMLKEIGFLLLGAIGIFTGKRTIDGKKIPKVE